MNDTMTGIAPTSTATTRDTEPEVIAGISSGDMIPGQKLAIRAPGPGMGYGRMLMLLAAGLAAGYGAAYLLRSRG